MEIFFSILPVLFFLIFLFLLDSFKLVIYKLLFFSLLWGICSAGFAYLFNKYMLEVGAVKFEVLSRYIAPASEELIKSLYIFLLIYRKRAGFMIDAAIYGFAIGAGFALVENIFYFQNAVSSNLLVLIIRGFGTALMHGGCTALIAIILISGRQRESYYLLHSLFAVAAAYIIHSAFNHFYINPVLQTIGIIILLPVIFIFIFRYNEKQLHNWLEIEFSSEVELLQMINMGKLSATRAGDYLSSLKTRFSGETIFDMYCYIRLYLELSIKAKRNLMLKESGFPPIPEPDIQEKLLELAALRKQIGKIGEVTLIPLIRMNYRDLWKLNLLR